MESYIQLRWLCQHGTHGGCGEFQQFCYPEAEPEAGTCPKCGRKTTTQLARCTGKVTWFVPYVTKPKPRQYDWVKGSSSARRSGKSTGRPRKKPVDNTPYVYKLVEVIEEDS